MLLFLPSLSTINRYGLAQHHWGDIKGAKKNFELAKVAAGLTTQLTGFHGRKTKYQSFDTQHLVVVAQSELEEVHAPYVAPPINVPAPLPLLPEEKNTPKADNEALGMGGGSLESSADVDSTKDKDATNDVNSTMGEDEDATDSTNKHAAKETVTGVKEYTLDEVDVDNIVLERINFTDAEYEDGGTITLFDQCILLALCLDVQNSNPKHGLTNLEMQPYITRVMDGSTNMNWMVHTSALVVRAWLEFEVWRTKTRAVMQLQALVDQHVNRLSAGQQAGTETYAPTSQRMRYVYILPLPSSWEMRSDLADRYMSLHIKHSALRLYEDLEKWEKVVQCYLDLERDKDATKLVQERLRVKPSPMLWCCLGELEDNDEHFRKAWNESGKRYARALRLLGGRRDRVQDREGALACYLESTAAAPNNRMAWWRIGSIAMSLEKWELSIRAWNNVIRFAPEDGEARGNLGATFTKMGLWEQAYHAFDVASQREYQNWRVWENKLFCAARTKRYAEAIAAQKRVVELRKRRKTVAMDWMVLEKITGAVLASVLFQHQERKSALSGGDVNTGIMSKQSHLVKTTAAEGDSSVLSKVVPDGDEDETENQTENQIEKNNENTSTTTNTSTLLEADMLDSDKLSASRHVPRLLVLFAFMVEHVPTSYQVWECYGDIAQVNGDVAKALECREKAFRALERGDWIEQSDASECIVNAAIKLCSVYSTMGKDQQQSGRLILKSMVDKLEARGKEVEALAEGKNGAAEEEDRQWRSALIAKLQQQQQQNQPNKQ